MNMLLDYEEICKRVAGKWKVSEKFKRGIEKNLSREFKDSLNFTGMSLEAYEIILFSYISASIALLIAIVINILLYLLDKMDPLFMFITLAPIPLFVLHYVSEYPKIKARYMKIHSLGDIPEIMSYIVMHLKLIPNLERAFRFAASQSNTSLARDLRKMLWDMEIRVYNGIDDAIVSFANLWGRWSDYFKRALYLVRNAIREKKESERNVTLNRALDVVLDGTRDKMAEFANSLHQPTLILYSMGVMMPLATVAMIPAVSTLGLNISIFQIFIIYDVLIPLILFMYIRKILLTRPATFNPPVIPEGERKWKRNVAGACAIFLVFAHLSFYHEFFILWGICLAVSVYCIFTYKKQKELRNEIREMEKEFGDALFILGKRVNEGKPPEEAFLYASEMMKGSKIGKIFSVASYNLVSKRVNSEEALFNEEFGSLRNVFSERIRAIMRLFVEGVKKSYSATGLAMVKIADHLKQLQDVENKIKNNLSPLTSSLRSTAIIFAPLIGGITLGLTKLLSNIMGKMNGLYNFTLRSIPYNHFVIVIGLYIILLFFLLIRFANGIDEGDDKIEYMYSIGISFPVSILAFTLSTFLSSFLFSHL